MNMASETQAAAATRAAASTFAFVALGSNLGDSARIIRAAISRLQTLSSQPLLESSLWRTTPVDCPPGSAEFVNAVVGLAPGEGESPESLLARLQTLELEFGRQPKRILNEPRRLDLDLVAFGAETRRDSTLVLPHPRAHLRRFVLQPLAEIAPTLILPGQKETVAGLLARLATDEIFKRIE